MKFKIKYENCEQKGEYELEIDCTKEQVEDVKKLIYDYAKEHPFFTSSHYFIIMLRGKGFKAKEIEYDDELWI